MNLQGRRLKAAPFLFCDVMPERSFLDAGGEEVS